MVSAFDAWLPVYSKHCAAYVFARIYVRVYCKNVSDVVVKQFTFAISSLDEFLLLLRTHCFFCLYLISFFAFYSTQV